MPSSKPLPNVVRWLLTIVVCLCVVGVLAFVKVTEIQGVIAAAAAQPEYSETVETARPLPVEFQPRIDTLGVVVAPLQVTLRSEMAGYITAVNAAAGAHKCYGAGSKSIVKDLVHGEAQHPPDHIPHHRAHPVNKD